VATQSTAKGSVSVVVNQCSIVDLFGLKSEGAERAVSSSASYASHHALCAPCQRSKIHARHVNRICLIGRLCGLQGLAAFFYGVLLSQGSRSFEVARFAVAERHLAALHND
jgi:hypothetical protein